MRRPFAAIILLAGLCAVPAQASGLLNATLGYFDLFGSDEAAIAGIEYRHDPIYLTIRPLAGISATSSGSAFLYGGLSADVSLGNFVITPSLAPGFWAEGNGKDLGQVIQFRAQLEVTYRLRGGYRLGLAANHISNWGMADSNPGAEAILFSFTAPISRLF